MAEKPLLCTSQAVRNLMSGRQTQDRRPMKKQPPADATRVFYWEGPAKFSRDMCADPGVYYWSPGGLFYLCKSPYSVGDLLYCRENYWIVEREGQGIGNQFILFDDEMGRVPDESAPLRPVSGFKWGHHPSIHHFKKDTRLWLEVTSVRAERIQDISEEDAKAEGIQKYIWDNLSVGYGLERLALGVMGLSAKDAFRKFILNKLYPGSWERNEWVFVHDLRRIER